MVSATDGRAESAARQLTRSAVPRNPVALCDGHGALLVADSGILGGRMHGARGRRKIEQPRGAGCSRSLAEASSCIPANGSSYSEVANTYPVTLRHHDEL